MAEKKLRDARIKFARVETGETLLSDGGGLYLRVRPTGKDWLFIFSLDGKRPKQGLGPYPDVTLEKAREKAAASRSLVAAGVNPVAHEKSQKIENDAAASAAAQRHTVRSLFEEWHRKQASTRKDAGAEIRRAFQKDVLPTIGEMYADEVKRRHIVGILDAVTARGVGRYANMLLQYLRQMFVFAAIREIVAGDPTFGLTKKNTGGVERERERHLSADEIREITAKLPDAKFSQHTQAALWIMLSTCCRVGEISRARHADLDLDSGIWVIPAEHSKNGREHLVHLSDFAKRQFAILQSSATSKNWLVPNRNGDQHLHTKALQRQFRDRQRDVPMKGRSKQAGALALSTGEWCAHDLRRTGATLMGELGIRSDVIDRCLNHLPASKLVKVYQQQKLLPERQAAFNALGDYLAVLTEPGHSRVVPLRRRA